MKCFKRCKFCEREYDGYGFRGYECLITHRDVNFKKKCPFWNKTIAEINENNLS